MILATALTCLAMNVYFEARGENLTGQHAVAQVTMNRAKRDEKNVCTVVTKRKQFSWTNGMVKYRHGQYVLSNKAMPKDKRAWKMAQQIAALTLANNIPDFLHGATYYHADYVNPGWNKGMRVVAVIGQHKFYKLA